MGEKWARKVHLQGHLSGWHEDEGERTRHEALNRTVRRDGYATTIRRLDFIANVANRSNNTKLLVAFVPDRFLSQADRLHRVARSDIKWLERKHEREG